MNKIDEFIMLQNIFVSKMQQSSEFYFILDQILLYIQRRWLWYSSRNSMAGCKSLHPEISAARRNSGDLSKELENEKSFSHFIIFLRIHYNLQAVPKVSLVSQNF